MYHDIQSRPLALIAALFLSLIAQATAKAGEVIVVTKEQDTFVADLNRQLECNRNQDNCSLKTVSGSVVVMLRPLGRKSYEAGFIPMTVKEPDSFMFTSLDGVSYFRLSRNDDSLPGAVFCYSSMSFKHSSSQCK